MKYLLILFGLSSVLAEPNPNFADDLLNSYLYTQGNVFTQNCIDQFLVNYENEGFESAVARFNDDKFNEDSNENETCTFGNAKNGLLDEIIKTYNLEKATD